MKKILIRVDASFEIGYGHLTRCINIAGHLNQSGIRSLFLLKHDDDNIRNLLNSSGIEYRKIHAETDLFRIGEEEQIKVVLTDINNPVSFDDKEQYEKYLESLQSNGHTVVTLEEFINNPYPADTVIIPYVGAETLELKRSEHTQYLIGPDYFMFREEFIDAPKVEIKDEAKNILVCMGGSDPDFLTEKISSYIIQSGLSLTVKIVLASIDETRRSKLETIFQSYKGKYEIIIRPEKISAIMASCDLGIVNSGLIKYETCILGLPCITISNHPFHEGIMNLFAQTGSILHLGLASSLDPETFNHALKDLVADKSKRETLSQKGIALFDGKGLERICRQIDHLIN